MTQTAGISAPPPAAVNGERFPFRRVVQGFLHFEDARWLFDVRIRGHYFWDFIRLAVFNELFVFNRRVTEGQAVVRYGRRQYGRYVREAVNLVAAGTLGRMRQPPPSNILMASYDRHERIDGRYVNKSVAHLVDHLHSRVSMLLLDPSQGLGQAARYPCTCLPGREMHRADRLWSLTLRYNSQERAVFDDIRRALRDEFDEDVDIYGLATQLYSYQLARYERYRRLFSRIRPKAFVYVDDGNMKGPIEAAHDSGVVAVDLQHSLMSDCNPLYQYLPASLRGAPGIADYVLTFGRYWNEEYRLPVQPVAVGFPFFERTRARLIAAGFENVEARQQRIIILTNTYFKSTFVRCALHLAELLPNHQIYYKLTSGDYGGWRGRYPKALAETRNITVIDSDDENLYDHLARCGYQVGINSTAIVEGMGLGLRTFVLNHAWAAEMRRFCDDEQALLVDGPEEIADCVRRQCGPACSPDVDGLFQPGSLENIERALHAIVAGGRPC